MQAIILAAGAGKRLGKITNNNPKCMLKLGKSSILEYQLESLQSLGIEDVTFILGYKKEILIDFLDKPKFNFFNKTYIVNNDYLSTNTIYSLWLARKQMLSDFLYFNADVLADKQIVKELVESKHENALAVKKDRCAQEEVKVILDNDVIIEIGKKLNIDKCAGEFIGIAKFSSKSNQLFIKCLEKYINNNRKNLFFEAAVNDLLSMTKIHAVDITKHICIEIDFPEDYETALKIVDKLNR